MKLVALIVALATAAVSWGQSSITITEEPASAAAAVEGEVSQSTPVGYVSTPIGWLHSSCVHELADNEWAEEGAIHKADGSIDVV